MDILDYIDEEIAGLLGMIAPFVAYGFISIAILLHDDFSWGDNALSDLGALGADLNIIFNIGIIITGCLTLFFILGVIELLEREIGYLGLGITAGAMICFIMVGLFPSGTAAHYWVAIGFFALLFIGLTVLGIDQMMEDVDRPWGIVLLSSVALSGAAAWMVLSQGLAPAIPEFIGTIPMTQFSLLFGARLYFDIEVL